MECQPNHRDLGGKRTPDDSLVVTGKVYRSGEESTLTDADLAQFEDLGIRAVVDLHSEQGAALRPGHIPTSAMYRSIPLLSGEAGAAVERFFQTLDSANFASWEHIYRSLIREQRGPLVSLIRMTADPDMRLADEEGRQLQRIVRRGGRRLRKSIVKGDGLWWYTLQRVGTRFR